MAEAEADPALDAWQRANVREMQAAVGARQPRCPEAQVEALSRATTACEAAWRSAKADADFAAVLPALAELLALVRETAAAKAERLGLSPYDALLDEYEPDGRADEIDGVFADLAGFLPDFLPRVLERQAGAPLPLEPSRPVSDRKAAGGRRLRLMERLGFDFHHGRLDVSLHPFCGGTPDDVRITTRYDEADFRSALMGVMHETGHALYERGPAGGVARPAGGRGARHDAAREPVAADRDAGLPLARVPRLRRRRCCARSSAATDRPGRPIISIATTRASSPASSASRPTR